jgi:excisionase family DNA binding protein
MQPHPGAWPRPKGRSRQCQAYAYARPFPHANQLCACQPAAPTADAAATAGADPSMIDQLAPPTRRSRGRSTDRAHSGGPRPREQWFDARSAAEYLGMHRDTLRKLAAQRAIPTHQDGPRCKLYFRRDELDEWRLTATPGTGYTPRLRAL